LTILLALQSLSCATQSWNDYFQAGMEALDSEDFYSARHYFKKCMEQDSSVFDLNVKYAESLRLTKDYRNALYYFDKVFSKDKGKLYPLGQFKLAEMQYMTGDYKKAIRNFKKFKRRKKKDVDDSFYDLANQWVVSATYALNAKNSILKTELDESTEKVNTSDLQFSPYKHGDNLYYTAYSENTDFLEVKEIYFTDSLVGEAGNVAILGLDPNLEAGNLTFGINNEVYFSVCSGDTCSIYYGEYNEGVISGIAKQNLFSEDYSATQPHLVQRGDEEFLFFVSMADGGQGGTDPINSSYHDLYYSYNSEDKKGWFSSNRPDEESSFSTCCSKIYAFEYPDSLDIIEKNYKDLEELNKYLPVTLYFHNDEPNPRTVQNTTEFNYLTTYAEYTELVPKYKKENSRGLKGDKKEDAELDVEEFFELLVQKGVNDLKIFTELLLIELESGISVELV